MAVHALAGIENDFATAVASMAVRWEGATAPQPRVLVLNEQLASELGLDPHALRSTDGVGILSGSVAPEGATPVAMAYAGHQFGGFTPLLGDGRALLLGELRCDDGRLVDVHLKGSGRTPFSRGGDGWAVTGPMLREYLISEAMHALGIPTTRALAVTATGRDVMRDGPEPGAVLTRIASSHLRVGTFEFAVRRDGLVQPLADYAMGRHYPELLDRPDGYLAFFESVVEAQASLVAQWMLARFVHGVMNTDNTTISGQTIDYGPCAFLDAFDPAAVFSSIDHGGRYAYGNQPAVLQWNLARFAETLLTVAAPTVDEAITAVTEVLETFHDRYGRHYAAGMAAKLGLRPESLDGTLVDDLLTLMEDHRADWTTTFRALATELRGDPESLDALLPRASTGEWLRRWRELLPDNVTDVADAMDRVNPLYIPRNHLVDAALGAATAGDDLAPFEELLDVVTHPFERREGLETYEKPAPAEFNAGFRTFCGT